jgi:glycosyltransferase involved in cell wall biosynthesis
MDGGGMRVDAFLKALERENCVVDTIRLGPRGSEAVDKVIADPLHRLKRRLLPVPLRGRTEGQLPAGQGFGRTISLIPGAHRWALRNKPTWLDFFDLYSGIAQNQARTVDPCSALVNVAQSRVWAEREHAAYAQANVVTAASWSDSLRLGDRAVWLPTPVTERRTLEGRRSKRSTQAGPVVYGMLANFHYPPNVDAYRRLNREWLNSLLPTASRIVVAGFGSEILPRVPNVDILGAVRTVDEFYDLVDVVVVPIERGGGMKVKVVEAMMHGAPVLATEHALTGLPDAIADEAAKWGQSALHKRDPRENPAVANALAEFTTGSFQQKFSALWKSRMQGDE